jgi:hypothetical protein
MRRVFDDPDGAAAVAERGRVAVGERNGLERAREVVGRLLLEGEAWWAERAIKPVASGARPPGGHDR